MGSCVSGTMGPCVKVCGWDNGAMCKWDDGRRCAEGDMGGGIFVFLSSELLAGICFYTHTHTHTTPLIPHTLTHPYTYTYTHTQARYFPSGYVMVPTAPLEGLRSCTMVPGAPSATTTGTSVMPEWFADSWDSRMLIVLPCLLTMGREKVCVCVHVSVGGHVCHPASPILSCLRGVRLLSALLRYSIAIIKIS